MRWRVWLLSEGRLLLRVGLMCAVILPSFMIGTRMAPIFFYSFGPFVAGFYAAMTARTRVSISYACLAASVMVTVILVGWSMAGTLIEIAWVMAQLFALFMGLLFLGVIAALLIKTYWQSR